MVGLTTSAFTHARNVRTPALEHAAFATSLCQPAFSLESTKQGQGTKLTSKYGGHSGILREEKEEGQEEGLQCELGGHCCGDEQHARVSSFGASLVLKT